MQSLEQDFLNQEMTLSMTFCWHPERPK